MRCSPVSAARSPSSSPEQRCGPLRARRGRLSDLRRRRTWWILDESELHFPSAKAKEGKDVVVPDLTGWRIERMPKVPDDGHVTLAPDGVCEVLSKGTEKKGRDEKMPIHAREGVRVAWLIDLKRSALEVYTLGRGRWGKPTVHQGAVRVRVPPFEPLDLDLSIFWAK